MSPHILICQEPVLTSHAQSQPAAGSHSLAGVDSAPHSEQNFSGCHLTMASVCQQDKDSDARKKELTSLIGMKAELMKPVFFVPCMHMRI